MIDVHLEARLDPASRSGRGTRGTVQIDSVNETA